MDLKELVGKKVDLLEPGKARGVTVVAVDEHGVFLDVGNRNILFSPFEKLVLGFKCESPAKQEGEEPSDVHKDILETLSDAINEADKTSFCMGDRLYEVIVALKHEWGCADT